MQTSHSTSLVNDMKNSIGTYEAKTHFGQLIKQVSQGNEILITNRGKAVAKIIPAEKTSNLESATAAVIRLRALAAEMNLGKFDWEEWKNYRDFGKK